MFTRRRLVVAALVAAFVGVLAALGAVSRSSPTAAPTVAVAPAGGVPAALWYWTMVVSRSDPNVLVLGTSNGLYRSGDGGKSWQPAGPKGVVTTSLVQAGSSIFMGGVPGKQGAESSPWVRKGSDRVAPDGAAVLEASTDEGKSWQVLHPGGLPNVSVQALAVDPANGNALYALLNTGKLYRSTDGARSFQLVSSKLGVAPWALAFTQDSHVVAGDMDSGSHVSANGKAWQRTAYTDSRGGRMVMEYAVQPTDATRLLMTSRGIEISTDSGKTWHAALKTDVMFGPVAWTPTKPDVAYAVGFDSSLWRTDDAGKTWVEAS